MRYSLGTGLLCHQLIELTPFRSRTVRYGTAVLSATLPVPAARIDALHSRTVQVVRKIRHSASKILVLLYPTGIS